MKNKEFLYVGHYYDENGVHILKIGTTNDLKRRQREHTRNYKKSPVYRLPKTGKFIYDFSLPLPSTILCATRTKIVNAGKNWDTGSL